MQVYRFFFPLCYGFCGYPLAGQGKVAGNAKFCLRMAGIDNGFEKLHVAVGRFNKYLRLLPVFSLFFNFFQFLYPVVMFYRQVSVKNKPLSVEPRGH